MSASLTASDGKPRAVLHVDLDGAHHIFAHHGWTWRGNGDQIYETGMEALLDFLAENKVKATLFAIAEQAEHPVYRRMLSKAVAEGHEIASHSRTHATFDNLCRDRKFAELSESRQILEDNLGTEVRGFRAPNFQIDRETFELLAECGYSWDSSTFPHEEGARRLRVSSVLPVPHRPLLDTPVLELPLPAYRPSPLPFHPSYSLLLGQQYFAWGVERVARRGHALVLLFHLVDFAEPLGSDLLVGWKSRLFTLSHLTAREKRRRCQAMLERLRVNFEIGSTRELVESVEVQPSPRLVLGVGTTHETSSALFDNHRCLAAISEERLDRVKFSTKYPPVQSIRQVIATAGIDPRKISDVVIAGLPAGKLLGNLVRGQLRDTFEFHGWNDYFPHFNKVLYRIFAFARALKYRSVLRFLRQEYGVQPRIHFIPHHLCHAASAYRTAPFDEALVVTADGVGDDTSVTISEARGGRIRLLKLIPYPHSFGQFYTACTQVLGFRANRHEGKITGLSAFGKSDPELYQKIRSTIRQSGPDFRLDKRFYSEGIIRGFSLSMMRRSEDLFEALQYRNYKKPLERLIEGHSREDVAAVFQRLLEEELLALVQPFAERTGLRNLCLAGGVFANVKANAALFRGLGFERVYIFPHMGDGGLASGAALELLQAKPEAFEDVYWGPQYSEERMLEALSGAGDRGLCYRREPEIERTVADLLAEHKVVARFNGRMEFGPRALGNRSILYSAHDPQANTWLNKRLGRTEFMPFAPVALEERAERLFKDMSGTEHACKFMTIILECTDWTKKHCPAVVHVDGTARPQLVNERINPSIHRILRYYEERTGVPLVVNTSFNMHEEPIVCSPEDAVRAFLASRLDYLAMGPYLAWIEESADRAVA